MGLSDKQKHAWCLERTGFSAVFLSPAMYAAVERDGGHDMRQFVINKPIPSCPLARKGTADDKSCMSGKSGKCVICGTGECVNNG